MPYLHYNMQWFHWPKIKKKWTAISKHWFNRRSQSHGSCKSKTCNVQEKTCFDFAWCSQTSNPLFKEWLRMKCIVTNDIKRQHADYYKPNSTLISEYCYDFIRCYRTLASFQLGWIQNAVRKCKNEHLRFSTTQKIDHVHLRAKEKRNVNAPKFAEIKSILLTGFRAACVTDGLCHSLWFLWRFFGFFSRSGTEFRWFAVAMFTHRATLNHWQKSATASRWRWCWRYHFFCFTGFLFVFFSKNKKSNICIFIFADDCFQNKIEQRKKNKNFTAKAANIRPRPVTTGGVSSLSFFVL